MKILITGCNGLIGKILMNGLKEHELHGIDIKEVMIKDVIKQIYQILMN